MIARRVVIYAVETQINHAKEECIDEKRNGGIEAPRERLIDEAAKENLFADRVKKDGRERVEGEDGSWRHKSTHLVKMEITANADTPVIRRIAIDGHPKHEEHKAAYCAGKRT